MTDLASKRNKYFELYDFQKQSVKRIFEVLKEHRSALLVLPTGTGKTRTFSEVTKYFVQQGKRVLVIAHREELIFQAVEQLTTYTDVTPAIEKAEMQATQDDLIVVASVQTLQKNRLRAFPENHFALIIIDEAHHALAKTYRNVIDHFSSAKLLGVTATPERRDKKELGEIFEEIAFQYPLLEAIENEFLVPIVGIRCDETIDLSGIRKIAGDLSEHDLEKIIIDAIGPIADGIAREADDSKTLAFTPSVLTASILADTLQALGLSADYLSGQHSSDHRRKTLERFKDGKIQVLCNCALLTEGFDLPSIQAIAMARPTLSRTLYAQCIGRGTRKFPGKKELKLIEFTYNSGKHALVSAYELFSSKEMHEKIREMAEGKATGKRDDFAKQLQLAHHEYHNEIESIVERIRIPQGHYSAFDPFVVGDLYDVDLRGEFTLGWRNGAEDDPITDRQIDVLRRQDIATAGLTKGQACMLIGALVESWENKQRTKFDEVKSRMIA